MEVGKWTSQQQNLWLTIGTRELLNYYQRTDDIIEAIYIAWNYEFDVYEVKTEELIFSGKEDNETNSEWLEPYEIRLIDDPEGRHRVLQDVKTGEIYKADWQSR